MEGTGPVLFRSFVPLPHHLPRAHWAPNHGWLPLGVGTPSFPQLPLRGAGPGGPAFTFAPPSLPPTLSGPAWLEGASVGRGSGRGTQQAPGVPSGHGKPGHAPFWSSALPMVPQFPPSGMGSLPLHQPPLRGASSFPASTSPPPSLPPRPRTYQSLGVPPVPFGVRGPPSVPGRCPCEETRIPRPPSPPYPTWAFKLKCLKVNIQMLFHTIVLAISMDILGEKVGSE